MPVARAVLPADPAAAERARAEMTAVLANMAESVLAAGGDPREQKVTRLHLERAAVVYLLSELRREFSQFKDGF